MENIEKNGRREAYLKRDKTRVSSYPKDTYSKLEFDKIIELVKERCTSPLGTSFVNRMKPSGDPEFVQVMLDQVHECKQLFMQEVQEFSTDDFLDLKEELSFLEVRNAVLNESQVFRLLRVLVTTGDLIHYFYDNEERKERYPNLCDILKEVSISRELINDIKRIIDKGGKVRNDASSELNTIRKNIIGSYRDLDRKFNSVLAEFKKSGLLADSFESIRNGRRVLAVLSEHKRKVRGIIHDESNTGSTTFIEPDSIVQINNDIVALQLAEKREVYKILQELTSKIRPHREAIFSLQKILGLFDFIRAKAKFAWETNAHKPRLSSDKTVELFNIRHPLLFLKNEAEKKRTVPHSFSLSLAARILLVSGPNAGGKSVLLKTVGLLQLMLQSGMLVSADDHSVFSIYRQIFVDMGDEQSIENDLSTYSSRLKNMRYFLEHANGKTLVLIDEFGSGTDPALGGPIAEAILEQLHKKFCYGVITTHYSNLKVFATQTKAIINGAMAFDHKSLSPLYKLEVGKPGSSFAFELAVKSGMPKSLLDIAKSKVDSDYKEFDELLSTLQKEKQDALTRVRAAKDEEFKYKKMLAEYERLKSDLEEKKKKILLEAEENALKMVTETNKKFEKLVRDIQESKAGKESIKKIKEEIQLDKKEHQKKIETLKESLFYQDVKTDEIKVGAHVRLRTGRDVGEVLELRKNKAQVQFGLLRTQVSLKELVQVELQKPKEEARVNTFKTLQAKSEFDSNIDIRGMRREEALKEVEDLIDRALVFNVDEVKIIHGIGTGVLRNSIRKMLRTYRSVQEVRDEDPQYGGQGVSIVELQ